MSIKKEKLKKLKVEADNAFKAKQQAYQNRKAKFDELLELIDQHNTKPWNDYKIKCKNNGEHIAERKAQADILHTEMVSLFKSSQEAYYSYDGALAKELSIKGHEKQEALKYYNKRVQELCEKVSILNEKAKEYAQKHQLSKSIKKLLQIELATLQEKFISNEEWILFKQTFMDAKFYDTEFTRLNLEYKKKQEAYEIYAKDGDDLALNDMADTCGNWEPFIRGWMEDGSPATVRIGKNGTPNEGQTLISDGHLERDDFNARHNHYGKNHYQNIKAKRIEDAGGDRGAYNGPGH